MDSPQAGPRLSRRERQIMDVIYELGQATAAQVHAALPDAPSYSTIRALLRILEDKGHLRHHEDGPRYVYQPRHPRPRAGQRELRRVLQTFFDGSLSRAVAALLGANAADVSDQQLREIETLIERARQGKKEDSA